jgi:hypothetical protein
LHASLSLQLPQDFMAKILARQNGLTAAWLAALLLTMSTGRVF